MKDFLFTLLAWLLTLPLIVGAIVFALYNGQDIEVTYSPFNLPVTLPFYIPVLGAVALGFILGSLMTWAGMSTLRHTAREQKKKIRALEKQLDAANQNGQASIKPHNYSLIPSAFIERK
jgi:uncharacterized integral membrane protein